MGMHRYRALLIFIVFFCVALIPHVVFGATGDFSGSIVQGESQTCPGNWESFLGLIARVIQFAIYLGIIIAVLMAAYAGFLWVLNPINPENRTSARGMLVNAAIGLVLTLSAWLIINTLLNVLGVGGIAGATNNANLGSPNADGSGCIIAKELPGGTTTTPPGSTTTCPSGQTCDAKTNTCAYTTPTSQPCGTNACTGNETCDTSKVPGVCVPPQACTPPAPTGPPTDFASYFSFDSGVSAQVPAASGALTSFLNCMAGNLSAAGHAAKSIGRISAITDSISITDTAKIKQCAVSGCKHTANSCHYGGTGSCSGTSYAVDFGDEQNADALRAAGRACNSSAHWNPSEVSGSNAHVHISIGTANSCSCDNGLPVI